MSLNKKNDIASREDIVTINKKQIKLIPIRNSSLIIVPPQFMVNKPFNIEINNKNFII